MLVKLLPCWSHSINSHYRYRNFLDRRLSWGRDRLVYSANFDAIAINRILEGRNFTSECVPFKQIYQGKCNSNVKVFRFDFCTGQSRPISLLRSSQANSHHNSHQPWLVLLVIFAFIPVPDVVIRYKIYEYSSCSMMF